MQIEEDVFSSFISCKICKQVLEDPVTLPCQQIVCFSHVKEIKETYKCFFCKKDHQIDLKELPINEV